MIIEPARIDDVDDIDAMRAEASAWLARRGIDQWSKPWPSRAAMFERIRSSIRAGETWMVRSGEGENVATVALDEFADPRLWTNEERDQPAMYMHRLIVRRRWSGLGGEIIDWATTKAAANGCSYLRVDVWTYNSGLHRYYVNRGFTHVRTLELDDYPSGALFQRGTSNVWPTAKSQLSERP